MPARISDKMGIKEVAHILLVNAPPEAIQAIDLPAVTITTTASGMFDHILLLVKTRAEAEALLSKLKQCISRGGKLWVIWPKGGKLGTDLGIKEVIRIGYNQKLVESTNLRIDDTWTALKFTHPKQGKVYNNSYGKLPS
jgi:hypothetical protein